MPGILEKTKDAIGNAAEAVKDKYHDLTDSARDHEERAESKARSAWEDAKDVAADKKAEVKGWGKEKYEKIERKFDY